MTVRNRRGLIALLMSVVLMLSFFTVGAFAEETSAISETAAEEVSESETEGSTANETEGGTANETESSTTDATEGTTASYDDTESNNSTELIVNLIIGGVIIIIAVVLIIKNRAKLAAFLRSVKSELKKIVWSSKEQTRKNFLVVIIICALVALLVFILDFAFDSAISGLASLFRN